MRLEDYFTFDKLDTKFGAAESIRLKGTRMSIDTIVEEFNKGASPREIVESYPSLTLEQVYAAITYYLHNKADVDEYIQRGEKIAEAYYQEYQEKGPFFLRDEALGGGSSHA
jgi:uncharacterized protein (DUF433 family)